MLTTAELQNYRREFERLSVQLTWTAHIVTLSAIGGGETSITRGVLCEGFLKRELEKARDRQGGA